MKRPAPLVAGNWKMNGLRANLAQIDAVKNGLGSGSASEVWIFPPATLLQSASALAAGSPLKIGAQDCHEGISGPFTGDLSAAMLKESSLAIAKDAAAIPKQAYVSGPKPPPR
jgi:triosephosphate isomerase (TIM)